MARLVGVDLPREKRVEIALTYIFGIGRSRAVETLAQTGVSGDTRVRDLGDDDLVKLRDWIESNYRIEGDLRRELPVRGQRTHTNARTRKGPRKAIAGKKKVGKK
jgi:small subunit ribosomal protein S13